MSEIKVYYGRDEIGRIAVPPGSPLVTIRAEDFEAALAAARANAPLPMCSTGPDGSREVVMVTDMRAYLSRRVSTGGADKTVQSGRA